MSENKSPVITLPNGNTIEASAIKGVSALPADTVSTVCVLVRYVLADTVFSERIACADELHAERVRDDIVAAWLDATGRTAIDASMSVDVKQTHSDASVRHSVGEALGLHSDGDPPLTWQQLTDVLGLIGRHLRDDGWTWCLPDYSEMTPDDWRAGVSPKFAVVNA